MSLKLKAKKLTRMSKQELSYRVGDYFRIRKERKAYTQELDIAGAAGFNFFKPKFKTFIADFRDSKIDNLLEQTAWRKKFPIAMSAFEHPNHADQNKGRIFKENFPVAYENTVWRAKRLLQKQFSFLGIDVQLLQKIQWQNDPRTGFKY
ncbi:MAG: hypothetical protein ACE5I1_14700, partial [bacterium]